MRVCIHRGAKEIGGTCIEVESQGGRILLDLGLPLGASASEATLLPAVPGLTEPDPTLLAIVLSHGHRDHWGLVPQARPDVPVVMGEATRRMMAAAVPWVPGACAPGRVTTMQDRAAFDLGPFRITPFLVDHSAYDAYALLVEADGRKLFYSGDFRAHGRKAALFERFLLAPPAGIDALLLEGTILGRSDAGSSTLTEADVEGQLMTEMTAAAGMVLVCASAQNIDRMVSLYRAAKRTGRTMLIDVYAAEMLRATGNSHIPQSSWSNVALFTPHHQRVQIRDKQLFHLLDRHKACRLFPEQLRANAPKLAMLFRPAMLGDLRRAACLDGARAVWSQWQGYLDEGSGAALARALADLAIPLTLAHTSGHASPADLRRFADALRPGAVVPIHSFEGHRYPEWFDHVVPHGDGEWWEV